MFELDLNDSIFPFLLGAKIGPYFQVSFYSLLDARGCIIQGNLTPKTTLHLPAFDFEAQREGS